MSPIADHVQSLSAGLPWRIAEGTKPVASRERTLAIIVYALGSRRLVNVKHADRRWSPSLTQTELLTLPDTRPGRP